MADKLWTGADVVMLLAFVFSVLVQVNDPDPLVWMTVYGLAAVACGLSIARRGHWTFPAAVAVATVIWAVTIAPRVVGRVPFLDMFGAFEMADAGIEESREMYGMLLVAAWMTVLSVRRARRRRAEPEPQGSPS